MDGLKRAKLYDNTLIIITSDHGEALGERHALGHPEWRDDPRFATNSARMANLAALTGAMNEVLATRTKAEWIAAFDAAGVPVGRSPPS